MTETRPAPERTNEVRLVGRVSAVAPERELPSGDLLVTFRLTVPRPRVRGRSRPAASVDAIDVACFTAVTRQRAARLKVGDSLEVRGALRRRFFRGAAGVQSRYDVEAMTLRRPPAQ